MKKKVDSDKKIQESSKDKDENSHLMSLITTNFKKTTKDPFILQLLSTQAINNHLFI